LFDFTHHKFNLFLGKVCKPLIRQWLNDFDVNQHNCMDERQKSVAVIVENFRVRGVLVGSPLFQVLAAAAAQKDTSVLSEPSGSTQHMRKVLRWMVLESYLIAYSNQLPKHGVRLINYPEMAMICGLHLELRIGNKLIKLLLSEAGAMCKVVCTCSFVHSATSSLEY